MSDYIARDSRYYARAFVRKVRDAARSLDYFAERGRIVPELNHREVRELIVGQYRLIYSLDEKLVHVLAFIHGARELGPLWEREHRDPPATGPQRQ